MRAHKMTIILALLFVLGLLAVDSVVAGATGSTAVQMKKLETGFR